MTVLVVEGRHETSFMQFEDLKIIKPILRALEDQGYENPTPIQEKAIPLVMQRRDVMGCAQTGTGKTAAFTVPIIQLIQKIEGSKKEKPVIRSLIVTPTRELAIQIGESIGAYGKYTDVKHAVIFGGVKQHDQVRQLKKGVHILVATPGRLLDLQDQGLVNIDTVKVFVLDEADRMLDMGFIHDIKKLIAMLPTKRQSLFFSATMPSNIVELSKTILTDPVKIEASPVSSAAGTIKQYIYYTNRQEKKNLLLHILDDEDVDQVLLFARTKHGADRIARDLKRKKVNADAIHGNKSQNQRQKALNNFKAGRTRVLVATDIAARGIDIDKLRYVINYDVPNISETYVHRIGRSGRAGEDGIAISLCEPEENAYVRDIEKLIKQKLEIVEDHPFPQTDKPMTAEEKKEWEKEKNRRRQEYFANRKKNRENGKGKSNGRSNGRSGGKPNGKKSEAKSGKSENRDDSRKRQGPPSRKKKNSRSKKRTAAFPERGSLGDFPLLT